MMVVLFPSNTVVDKTSGSARCWWLKLVILATPEAEIKRLEV
jgi:hypothetical protein